MPESLSRALVRFAAWIEQEWPAGVVVFTLLYLSVTTLRALRRMWYDELFTYYMASLPDLETIWAALKEGADLNPPLLYIATRASHFVLGDGHVATRLPAILGFLLMCLCVSAFVGRRTGRTFGLAAMVLPVLTGTYAYAAEARSYGMVLGFGAAAALSWQYASAGIQRRFSIPCTGVFLAAALLTHCYAVLLLVPFAAAELTRALKSRRLDVPLAAAIATPLLAGITYVPMLGALRTFVLNTTLFRPTLSSLAVTYTMMFAPAIWALLVGALVVTVIAATNDRLDRSNEGVLAAHEIAFASALLLLPFLAAAIAGLFTNVYMSRYSLSAVI